MHALKLYSKNTWWLRPDIVNLVPDWLVVHFLGFVRHTRDKHTFIYSHISSGSSCQILNCYKFACPLNSDNFQPYKG